MGQLEQVEFLKKQIQESINEYATKKNRYNWQSRTLGWSTVGLSVVVSVVSGWQVIGPDQTSWLVLSRNIALLLSSLIGALGALQLIPLQTSLRRARTQGALKDLQRAVLFYLAGTEGGTTDQAKIEDFMDTLTRIRQEDTRDVLQARSGGSTAASARHTDRENKQEPEVGESERL